MHFTDLSTEQKQLLLLMARQSIQYGARTGKPLPVQLKQVDAALTDPGCSFVTLNKAGELRGCIGALDACRPLVQDVVEHAYSAAFSDYRFQSVNAEEIASLHIEISVLTPQTPILCGCEEALLEQLQPFTDGLTLEEGNRRATFLPSVWEKLPDKHLFLRELKRKAGLPRNYWAATIKVSRYHSISFAE